MREAQITRRRIDGESVEDIEQQLEREAYESCEEADEVDILAAISSAAEPFEVQRSQRLGNGSAAALSKRLGLYATILGWFRGPATQPMALNNGTAANI